MNIKTIINKSAKLFNPFKEYRLPQQDINISKLDISKPFKPVNCPLLLFGILLIPLTLFRFNNQKNIVPAVKRSQVLQASTGDKTVDFLYDSSGQRIAKLEENGDNTYYLGASLEIVMPSGSESVSDITWKRNYSFSGRMVAVREVNNTDNNLYFLHQDHLASNSLITDGQGNLISRQTYYPYGTTRYALNGSPTERQYTGQVSDEDLTGLYYYNARYYNPTTAKFTQADEDDDSLNRYAYVANNPTNFIDLTGNEKIRYTDRTGIGGGNSPEYAFYQNLINTYMSNYGREFNNLTVEEKINYLSNFVFSNINYSSRFISVWDRQNNLSHIENYLPITPNTRNSNIRFSRSERMELINEKKQLDQQEISLWEEYAPYQGTVSNYERVNKDLLLCYDIASIFDILAEKIVPEIPIITVGIGEHAINLARIDNTIYTIDPTWDWPLLPISDDISLRQNNSLWISIGFLPLDKNVFFKYFKDALSVYGFRNDLNNIVLMEKQ